MCVVRMCAKTGEKRDRAPNPFVSTPMRVSNKDSRTFRHIFSSIAQHFPRLKQELEIAEMDITPVVFIRKSLMSAAILTIILEVILVWLFISQSVDLLNTAIVFLITTPLIFLLSFNTSLFAPRVKIIKRGREIDKEIVFAGRHLLIELRSGVTLFDAMLGVSKEYGDVSKEFNKIVEKVTLGVPISVALHEIAENSPSVYFKRVLLQVANSISSGSDVGDSLEVVLDQVAKEQIIQLKAYGQKLNPLVMFYMLFGVIIPSLGVAFMIIVFSVIGAGFESMGLTLMAATLVGVLTMQYLFLSIAENSRPNFDL